MILFVPIKGTNLFYQVKYNNEFHRLHCKVLSQMRSYAYASILQVFILGVLKTSIKKKKTLETKRLIFLLLWCFHFFIIKYKVKNIIYPFSSRNGNILKDR